MNSSTRQVPNIIVDSSIIILASIKICISASLFGFITYHTIISKNSPHRVALLLTANVYLSLQLSSILFLEEYICILLGHKYSLASLDNGILCQIRIYLQYVLVSAICYSNALQAIYRLCRIIFYTKKSYQSFQLYQILSIIQWILCFLIMFPSLYFGDFKYSINDYSCQLDYANYRGVFMIGTLSFSIPMTIIVGCNIYTIKKMRRRNNNDIEIMTQLQRMIVQRDLVVLFRLLILLGILMTFGIIPVMIILINIFTGLVPWWSSQIQWLVFNILTTIVSIVLIIISPHFHNLWKKKPSHLHCHRHAVVKHVVI
ncbi:unnamed protein product [Adineta steineri]|uniref:G-protein coupled receptors family 1 profile domain-containing protein n=1 Tax=Adineta steineri TaxID=433720 RepID=A0A818NI25_9BILA|nr:unnamed protein product [Adineta steineri]